MWELATSPSSSDDGASALPVEAEMQRVDTQPGRAGPAATVDDVTVPAATVAATLAMRA